MLTRRTAAFRAVAETAERLCRDAGVEIDAEVVDEVVRHRIGQVAAEIGVSDRVALGYAPPDLGELIAETIIEADQLNQQQQQSQPRAFGKDAPVYTSAPAGGGVCCRCGGPIEAGAPAVSVPGLTARGLAHPDCIG